LDLPDGVVLFEGDIGSGKSTLLYALEFALFGFSDLKGGHLLSEGKKEGKVWLAFEAGDTEYMVERSLRLKGTDVVQDECHISAGGRRERLSPSDLKERIVSILGFNEPTHPKAESLVYRYAVFTPQEQMKVILTQNSEDRLHVIRRILGAQSYQVAAENSEIVERRIKEIAYGLKKSSEDYEGKKAEAESKSKEISGLEASIPRQRKAEAEASRLVRSLEVERQGYRDELLGFEKGGAKATLLKRQRESLKEDIAGDGSSLKEAERRLAEDLEPTITKFEGTQKPGRTATELNQKSADAREKLGRLRQSKSALRAEIEKTKELVAKGICPYCGQRITGEVAARTEHVERDLASIEKETVEAEGLAEALDLELKIARDFEEAEKEYNRARVDRARVEKELGSLRRKVQESNMRFAELTTELAEAERQSKSVRAVSDKIDEIESKIKDATEAEKKASQEVVRTTTELENKRKEHQSLLAELARKASALQESRKLSSYQSWLSTYFRPSVQLIERQTLSEAASRFNEHFQRFFTTLVDDPDMVVKVNNDFSPIFEREGFEQDFAALSGGERTSMALAYRFALNAVVKESVSEKPELLILDEPTEGFSREQVYKMRGLLDELGSRQVIMVSHERELESMADHVFRVEKRNGSSIISEVRA
jgi:DNA repair protein SbcC/Rad50